MSPPFDLLAPPPEYSAIIPRSVPKLPVVPPEIADSQRLKTEMDPPVPITPSPTAESDDETREISALNYSLEPRARPFYSPSDGNPSLEVFNRVTVTLSHYPGGDLIETPKFVQNITPTDVLDLTDFLQNWGGPHLYYHNQWDDIAIVPRRFDFSSLQELRLLGPNGELSLFMYPYSLSTSIARSAGTLFMRSVATHSISLLADVLQHDHRLLFVGGLILTSLWVIATVVAHAHYDIKDFPRARKIGFSLGCLIIPSAHITPRPYRFTPPPTSPKDDTRDEEREIFSPKYRFEPHAGPVYSPSERKTPPGVFKTRVTVTLSYYPGGDLIETPEFVQNVTLMNTLNLTEILQTWGGPHLYYHDKWNNIAIVPQRFGYSSLRALGVIDPNGESHVLPLFIYPYSLSTSIARSASALFTRMMAINSISLFVDVHDPFLYVGGVMLSTFMVFVAVVGYAHHDAKDFPRSRRIGYSLVAAVTP
ncbi:hypothetical protein PILCRDRAFT_827883 [Piloderma croceum F 1598]|uniref:Uncharacterized protein n=1 Tax=Piloderma croceum (strain F 1598) TaxID=765440 RepID=A0A0C3ALQ1_PILCF|nr:hypothetical protein PILCRDRAFT_827883 [Piloderma croceum F 1598]